MSVSESLSAGNIWIGQVVRSDGLYIVVHYFLLSSTYFTDDGASRILTDFATELSLKSKFKSPRKLFQMSTRHLELGLRQGLRTGWSSHSVMTRAGLPSLLLG